MQRWKSAILIGALALAADTLLAAPQGATGPQASPPSPSASVWEQRQTQFQRRAARRRWQRRRWRHRQHRRRHFMRLGMMLRNPAFRERLGITPEQAARMQAQQSAFVKARIRSRADVQLKRLELAELMATEKPDRALLEKKLRELHEAQFVVRKATLEHRLAMRETLTPEQREKLRALVWEYRARRMHGGWEGPGSGGPRSPLLESKPAAPGA